MGRTSTHVANRYRHTIYVRCDAERRRLTEFSQSNEFRVDSISKSNATSSKSDVNIIQAGFTKIMPGEFVKFEVDCTSTRTVYISIYAWDGDKYELICDNLPKNEDKSVIVERTGQVVDTKYGRIWQRV